MKYEADFDLEPEELAWIFDQKDWQWAVDEAYGVPHADDIRKMISTLVRTMDSNSDVFSTQSGRLAIVRDPMFPDSYELYLCVGHIDVGEVDAEEAVA